MKEQWIERLIRKLIVEQNYILVKSSEGKVEVRPDINIMIQHDGRQYSYLQIINGNACSLEWIQQRLMYKDNVLIQLSKEGQVKPFALIVFPDHVEKEKIEWVEGWQNEHLTEQHNYKCLVADISGKKVESLFASAASDRKWVKLLNSLWEESTEPWQQLSMEQLVEKKKQQYSVKYKTDNAWITKGLIAVNILVFIGLWLWSMKTHTSYDKLLIPFGAKVNDLILQGQVWRLVTPIFLHGGLMHLLVNCYSLYILGSLIERLYGRGRFIFCYMVAGILGNIMSFVFSNGYSVGASGAIFGLMGALLYYGIDHPVQFRTYFGRSVVSTIVINLVYGLSPGIDNYAHLGGLIGGFLAMGMVCSSERKAWYVNRFVYIGVTVWVAAASLFYGFNGKASQITRQVAQLEQLEADGQWAELEAEAQKVIEMEPSGEEDLTVAWWELTKAQLMQEKYQEALDSSEQLVQVSPVNGHYLKGCIYIQTGQLDAAKEELEQSKQLGGNSDSIDELLRRIEELQK